jgi:hypothetical protein
MLEWWCCDAGACTRGFIKGFVWNHCCEGMVAAFGAKAVGNVIKDEISACAAALLL